MPELGRGMLFPRSYFRDQFTPAQEEAMEAAQAAAEDVEVTDLEALAKNLELLADALSTPGIHADEEAA